MKERSKKAQSPNNSFKLEPGEVFFGVRRAYLPNSHINAYEILKLTQKESGEIFREVVFGPDDIQMVLPHLQMFANEFIETLQK